MAGTIPLREGAHRMNAAALIHGELKSEGIVAVDALISRPGLIPRGSIAQRVTPSGAKS
jgi:hypothetical protein